jgi:hypothetical protein
MDKLAVESLAALNRNLAARDAETQQSMHLLRSAVKEQTRIMRLTWAIDKLLDRKDQEINPEHLRFGFTQHRQTIIRVLSAFLGSDAVLVDEEVEKYVPCLESLTGLRHRLVKVPNRGFMLYYE